VLGVLGAGVGIAAAVAGMDGRAAMELFGVGTDVGVLLPFSRSQEAEADEIGLILMARAGYDPRAAIALWERMAARGDAGGGTFLSTHPSHGSRVARLRAALPGALAYYAAAEDGTRLLPGVTRSERAASPGAGALASAMHRLDALALDPRHAEDVAFAIAHEVDVGPESVVTVLADSGLSPGEAALAFVLAKSGGRSVDDVIAAAARTSWEDAARASGLDLAQLSVRLDRIASDAVR